MLSSEKIKTVQHERRYCRVLPLASKEKTRSSSLPKVREKIILREQLKVKHCADRKVNQSFSHSMHTLSKHGVNKSTKGETGEVPVVIDEVTK